jgi:hypothetical protein
MTFPFEDLYNFASKGERLGLARLQDHGRSLYGYWLSTEKRIDSIKANGVPGTNDEKSAFSGLYTAVGSGFPLIEWVEVVAHGSLLRK